MGRRARGTSSAKKRPSPRETEYLERGDAVGEHNPGDARDEHNSCDGEQNPGAAGGEQETEGLSGQEQEWIVVGAG